MFGHSLPLADLAMLWVLCGLGPQRRARKRRLRDVFEVKYIMTHILSPQTILTGFMIKLNCFTHDRRVPSGQRDVPA